jgi:hypothetical protein
MTRAVSLTLMLLLGCTAEQQSEASLDAPELVEGAPCQWKDALCIDDVDMLHCHDGTWTQQSCADYCGSLGRDVSSIGCNTEESMARPEVLCSCAPPAQGCQPGQTRCDTTDTLGWCADDWTWRTASCDVLCINRSLLSNGCGPFEGHMACLCTNVGMPCEGKPSVCVNDVSLASCVNGAWAELDCSEVCGSPAPCEPGQDGGAACSCGS